MGAGAGVLPAGVSMEVTRAVEGEGMRLVQVSVEVRWLVAAVSVAGAEASMQFKLVAEAMEQPGAWPRQLLAVQSTEATETPREGIAEVEAEVSERAGTQGTSAAGAKDQQVAAAEAELEGILPAGAKALALAPAKLP
jgi:hypothetical protein